MTKVAIAMQNKKKARVIVKIFVLTKMVKKNSMYKRRTQIPVRKEGA